MSIYLAVITVAIFSLAATVAILLSWEKNGKYIVLPISFLPYLREDMY
jgi:hypothetical protein